MAVDNVFAGMRPLSGGQGVGGLDRVAGAGKAGGADFSNRLEAAIRSVSDTQNVADVHLGRMASGEEVDIHTTMIAMQEADIQLRTMVSVRDKVVEAYQQMMNMSV
jgi:flagellar hook-basal body complex protein FliE